METQFDTHKVLGPAASTVASTASPHRWWDRPGESLLDKVQHCLHPRCISGGSKTSIYRLL